MTEARRAGLALLVLGIVASVLLGCTLQHTAPTAMGDFKAIYYNTRCLLEHRDPYRESEFLRFFRDEFGTLDTVELRGIGTLSVYLPSTFLLIVPLAMLPCGLACGLWTIFATVSLSLAAFLMWNLGANYAPILSGGLIGLLLANSAIVLGNGNPAGLVVGLCVIAVWCFLKERFVPAGILCLAISLAIKPHDAGLVWLYFLLVGGVHRKRALQTLAVNVVMGLAAILWVSSVAPHWVPEMRSNLAEISAPGRINDPGPAGYTDKTSNVNQIINLQAAISIFRDDPRFYNPVSYLVCGTLLLLWSVAVLKSGHSPARAWFALAAVSALTMLVTYHRIYDAKLLLLAVPACAMLWAKGGTIGKIALAVNAAGFVLTGEIPLETISLLTKNLRIGTTGLAGEILTVVLIRPASLILLAMAIFYLWVYVRRASDGTATVEPDGPEHTPVATATA